MSIFISWRGSDRDVKNELVAHLRNALPSEEIWESDEGCTSNFSADFITKIRRSEIFVVIVSDESMKPSYVLNEVIEAHNLEFEGRLNMLVFKITESPYTPAFAANLNHITDANHVAYIKGTKDGFSSLASKIERLLEMRRRGEPEKPYDTFIPEIKGTAIGQGYYVQGSRNRLFEEIDRQLETSKAVFLSQISGYGKKSAAREFALEYAHRYKKTVYLHFFGGTLREFFIRGIEFTNVSSDLFARISENEVILKKAELLSRLSSDTLVIVPSLTPENTEDRFVLDALNTVGCRIIFIAEEVPPYIRRAFPEIAVGRMENKHLSELFFNYYSASEDEQNELSQVLADFFDSIDGHTRSVEIAATTIADEYGIYPEDLPEILGKIRPNSENSLSEKIFELSAEMFDSGNFNEKERDVLLAASLFARTPLDEKEFVGLLKEAECYDADALRRLAMRKWINSDKDTRTISIDNFLANVCYAKIGLCEELCGRLFAAVNTSFSVELLEKNHGRARALLRRCHTFFEIIGLEDLSAFTARILKSYDEAVSADGISNSISAEELEELSASILRTVKRSFSDESLKGELLGFFDLVKSMFSSFSVVDEGDLDLSKGSAEQFFTAISASETASLLEALAEMEADGELREILNEFVSAFTGANLMNAALACERLLGYVAATENGVQVDFELLLIVQTLTELLSGVCAVRPYLALRILRQWRNLESTFGSISDVRSYDCYKQYLTALYRLEKFDGEFDEIAECCFCGVDAAIRAGMFKQEEKEYEHTERLFITLTYADGLICRGDTEEALRQIRSMEKYASLSQKNFENYIIAMAEFVNDCANKCATDAVSELCNAVWEFADKQDFVEIRGAAADALRDILEIRNALRTNDVSGAFDDGTEEYLDYYRAFAEVSYDKKLFELYEKIAEQAKAIDLSSLSDGELKEKVASLKSRAAKGEKSQDLSPEAFALVSEAGYRVLGYRHHLVQYIGGAAIADGKIAEILNGEGKTYTLILAAFLHFLYGKTVHIIDSSEYLTVRNYNWMRGVLSLLGCKVGCYSNPYVPLPDGFTECDVLYETHIAILSAYMRGEFALNAKMPPLDVAIIDEAEELLIVNSSRKHDLVSDEVIANHTLAACEMLKMLCSLTAEEKKICFSYNSHRDRLTLNNELFEKWFLHCQRNGVDISAFSNHERGYLYAAVKCLFFMKKGRDYFLQNGRIEQEASSGRFVGFGEPYNFFLRMREHLPCSQEMLKVRKLANTYIFREFIQKFGLVSGATATARAMQKEFEELYGLDIIAIPPNEQSRRIDNPPEIYMSDSARDEVLISLIAEKHALSQPVLVVTSSVDESVRLSRMLDAHSLPHTLLNAENEDEQAEILSLAGCKGRITVTTALANRGIDIRLGGNPISFAKQQLADVGFSAEEIEHAAAGLSGSEELRRKYLSLVAILSRRTEKEREYLNGLGGLCVIGASCFDELRTEQQLRGRSGRQGDKGESHILFSLEDKGLRELFPEALHRRLLDMFATLDGSVSSRLLLRRIENTRLTLQQHNYRNSSNSYTLAYRPAARQKFLAILQNLASEACDMDALVKEYYADFLENATAAFEYAVLDKPCRSDSIKVLVDTDKNAFSTKKKASEALYGILRKRKEYVMLPLLRTALAKLIADAWSDYITLMNNEEFSPISQGEKLKKRLVRRSEDITERLISQKVTDIVDCMLRSDNT